MVTADTRKIRRKGRDAKSGLTSARLREKKADKKKKSTKTATKKTAKKIRATGDKK